MWQRLYDNPLSRRIFRALEDDHNRRLGIRNTMRVARAFNHLKNRRQCAFRKRLYAHHRHELLAENGPIGHRAPRLEDAWAIDDSRAFRHLDRLLEDAQEVIAERAGVQRGGAERSFFQQLLTDEHIARYPSFLDFATSSEVLEPVLDSMGCIPVLSVAKPLGVRLNESDERLGDPTNGTYRESQLFHRDYHDAPMVYVLVTLRDVTRQSGPFSILPASTSDAATAALRYGRRGRSYRVQDDEMYDAVDRSALFEFARPAGSVLFVDSSRCFHYGSRDAAIPRYLMMYAYVSVCRCDFGDVLRKERPAPVVDDTARTERSRYPVGERDSRLRRLLLDRELSAF